MLVVVITVVDTLVVGGIEELEVILVVFPFVPVEVEIVVLIEPGTVTVLLEVLVITAVDAFELEELDCVLVVVITVVDILVVGGTDELDIILLVSLKPVDVDVVVLIEPGRVTVLLDVLVMTVVDDFELEVLLEIVLVVVMTEVDTLVVGGTEVLDVIFVVPFMPVDVEIVVLIEPGRDVVELDVLVITVVDGAELLDIVLVVVITVLDILVVGGTDVLEVIFIVPLGPVEVETVVLIESGSVTVELDVDGITVVCEAEVCELEDEELEVCLEVDPVD